MSDGRGPVDRRVIYTILCGLSSGYPTFCGKKRSLRKYPLLSRIPRHPGPTDDPFPDTLWQGKHTGSEAESEPRPSAFTLGEDPGDGPPPAIPRTLAAFPFCRRAPSPGKARG